MKRDDIAAERVRALAARTNLSRTLGFSLLEGGAGHAALVLTVDERHLNAMGACHGGVIFALADEAFGMASNSHGIMAAGIDAHITYQVAVQAGDRLVATATEVSRSRRLAVYRVEVRKGEGVLVASFTGTVYVTGRHHEPPLPGHEHAA